MATVSYTTPRDVIDDARFGDDDEIKDDSDRTGRI